jgi:Fe-S oxidoreductase
MATYKAEFLAQHYRHRLRPRADYALGWLPAAANLVARTGTAPAVNALTRRKPLARLATRAAGLEDRPIPTFAPETLQQWWGRRVADGADAHRPMPRGRVLLWPDTFTNAFHPQIGRAAVELLEAAGWEVEIPTEPICCGLTWISTGQLNIARKVLRRTIRRLAPHVRDQGFVVGLEPSCTAVFRSDMHEFFPDDQDAHRLKDHVVTLAELLTEHTDGWQPPQAPSGTKAIAQVHCHQHAILKWEADSRLLERAGVHAEQLDSGCCGLAGNFGFTAGHGEVSRALAEQTLLPRVREADDGTVVLADGFSCRTQIADLDSNGREGVHLAELLAGLLRDQHETSSRETRGGTT